MPTSAPADLQRVTVILATFYSSHCIPQLGRCLALFPNVVIIDNASEDDTLLKVAQHLPHAKFIANKQNRGFGAANNQGVKIADTEFLLLLNPDCIIDPASALALIKSADRHPDASAIGPQLLGRRGQLDLSYGWTPDSWKPKGAGADADTCVGFISGACMLIRKNAMVRINGFDERFFLYQEDTDLCIRLAQQCGALILAPEARVTHQSRGSSGGRARVKAEYIRGYHHIQSKFLFDQKHHRLQASTWMRLRYCATAALEAILRIALFDLVRASRALGRVLGAWRYPNDMKIRQVAF